MKELLTLAGGYPRQMDFLLNLQTEMLALGNSMFSSFGFDFVLSGCAITDNGNGTVNIAPGIVYIGGEAIRYDGDSNVISDGTKALLKGAYIASDMRMFGDGSNKNIYREAKAFVTNATALNLTELKVKPVMYTINEYIKDTILSSEVKGAIREVYDLDGTFDLNFDDSGLGITPRWIGWALDNGNFSPGSAGKVLLGAGRHVDTLDGEETIYNAGETGGRNKTFLTTSQMPTGVRVNGERSTYNEAIGTGDTRKNTTAGGGTAVSTMQDYVVVYRVVKIV